MKRFQRVKSNVKLVDPETFNRSELQRQFQAGEITFEQYMEGSATGVVASSKLSDEHQSKQEASGPLFEGNPEPRVLTTAAAALKFILAGNAYFTLRSKVTGTRYTYRVNKPEPQPGKCKYCLNEPCRCALRYFVSLLTGPENTGDYTYLGMIARGRFQLTRASKMNVDSLPVKAISWTIDALNRNQLSAKLEIWHEGRCGRCGRMLTVPESIALGLGPECAGRG